MTTTTAPATARDALANRIENLFYIQESGVARMDWGDMADAMITALHDAGYTIVYRNTDADVEARAREALANHISVLLEDDILAALTAAGVRLVDAAADDSRTEALIRHRQFVAALDKLRFDVGPDDVFRYDRVKDLRRALDPYLHDDDAGGEG